MDFRSDIHGWLTATGGDTPALITETGETSPAALAALAAAYQQVMPPPGHLVAILGSRKTEDVALMLAALFSGCPFVFVEDSTPPARLAQIRDTLGIATCLGHGHKAATLGARNVADLMAPQAVAPTLVPMPAQFIFYYVFTSGSTGVPKACPVSYGHFDAFCGAYAALPPFEDTGCHVALASFGFDMGMSDLWPSMASGKTLIIAGASFALSPRQTLSRIAGAAHLGRVSLIATPTVAQLLMKDRMFSAAHLGHLRSFVFGGEAVMPGFVSEITRRFPDARVFNGYGPSEATCITHLAPITRVTDAAPNMAHPVGHPIGETIARIVDETGAPVPVGTVGEIVLVGAQVIDGYLPQTHPANAAFARTEQGMSYATGDLGYLDETGALCVAGRKDQQIKWRGVRLELGEFEAVATATPGIDQAVVLAERVNGAVVDLWVFAQTQLSPDTAQARLVQSFAASCRPDVLPRRIVCRADLPVTPNGKVDRKGLSPWMSSMIAAE